MEQHIKTPGTTCWCGEHNPRPTVDFMTAVVFFIALQFVAWLVWNLIFG